MFRRKQEIRWCCEVFKGWYQSAGERGIGILVEADDEHPIFILQHRSIDEGVHLPADFMKPVDTISEVHFHFCPWCGKKLRKRYPLKVAKRLSRLELRIKALGLGTG